MEFFYGDRVEAALKEVEEWGRRSSSSSSRGPGRGRFLKIQLSRKRRSGRGSGEDTCCK